jgi:hypothetical protein
MRKCARVLYNRKDDINSKCSFVQYEYVKQSQITQSVCLLYNCAVQIRCRYLSLNSGKPR